MWTTNSYGQHFPSMYQIPQQQQRQMMIPVKNHVIPVQNHVIPVQNHVIPVQRQVYPVQNHVIPVQRQVYPLINGGPIHYPMTRFPVRNPSMNFIGPQQRPFVPMVNQVYRHHCRPHNGTTNYNRCIPERQYDKTFYKQEPKSLQLKEIPVSDTSTTVSSFDTTSSSVSSNSDTTVTVTIPDRTKTNKSSEQKLNCKNCNALVKKTKMFYLNTKENVFCLQCFKPGMKGLHGSFCHEFSNNNCDKKATWGYAGEGKVLTCRDHRLDNMINVNVKTCHFIDKETKRRCKHEALYALKSNKNKRLYCELHCNRGNMVYVRKRCNKKKRV